MNSLPCSSALRPFAAILCAALSLAACRSAEPAGAEVAAIHGQLARLYEAFCFDPGEEPDWEAQRRIYLPGAVFIPPIRSGRAPVADNTQQFLADFRAFATSESYRATGFHERIIGTHIEVFGGIAHALVAFEGYIPGEDEVQTRGLDSIQLVYDGDAWRLVSFSTQYEHEGLVLSERFKRSGGGIAPPP